MFRFNTNALQRTIDNFFSLFNASISFYDENFETIASSHDTSMLCSTIKESMQYKCLISDDATFNKLKDPNINSFKYNCHFGFIEIAHKILVGNRVVAYLLIGPFRDEERYAKDIENIKKLTSNNDIQNILIDRYMATTTINENKYHAIIELLGDSFNFEKDNKYLNIESDFFYSKMHPYIVDHISEKLDVIDLCDHFYMSRKQIYSLFKKQADTTPKKYINSLKVKRAIYLLTNTSLSLEEISEKIGIFEYTYFSKIFKKYCGHTPKYFRSPNYKKEQYGEN